MGRRRLPLVVAALLALAPAACAGGGSGGGEGEPAAAPTPAPSGTSTTAVGSIDAGDWAGERFDLGIVDRIDRTEDGRTVVVLDRVQLLTGGEPLSGDQFVDEPIVFGNTDVPFQNDSNRLRTYVLHPQVEVLRLANGVARIPDGKIDDVVEAAEECPGECIFIEN
ncbi:MAG TPA: ferredoxin [Acidimicrobiales bacterium]|nr:ferredoxin [Acidimicrobiales bacterium]